MLKLIATPRTQNAGMQRGQFARAALVCVACVALLVALAALGGGWLLIKYVTMD